MASRAELYEEGIGARQIDRSVERGDLLRVRKGWIALPGAPADVLRAVRIGGRLSCLSVLRPQKIWCANDRRLHVRVPADGRSVSSPHDRSVPLGRPERYGIALHRSRRAHGLTAPIGAVDPFEWALLHSVECQSRVDAIVTLDSPVNRGRISLPELHLLLGELPKTLRAYLDFVDPSSQSGLETKARLGLRALGISYRSQVAIDGVGIVDLVIGDRLVLEVDGEEWHSGAEAYAVDRERDLRLVELGYSVIRLTYDQVMDEWDRIIAAIRALVGRGEHRWKTRHHRAGLGLLPGFLQE